MIIKCPKCGYSIDSNSPKCNIESDRPDDKVKCLECGCIDTYENFIEKTDFSILVARLHNETGVYEEDINYIISEYYKWRTQNGI